MPRYSANISIMFQELPFLERFHAARTSGFDGVECWFPYDHPKRQLSDLLDGLGLTLVGINTAPGDAAKGEWGITALPGREADFDRQFAEALDYAMALGVRGIHVMAAMTGRMDQKACEAAFMGNLERAARRAEGSEVNLLIEPLNSRDRPGYFLSRSDQAISIITQIGAENLKLMFDVYHVQVMEGDILCRLRSHLPHIGHIQIAAVPTRHEPDEGELNYRAILAEIDALGWQGWVGCEYKPRAGTVDGLGWREAMARV
ncbi:MAG: TIM barrel protein [Hyphomicrobiales bacterium]|nr:TIM barrel protein [Hyphomicrobiales bacterium]